MAVGFLTPDARLRIVTDLGVVAPGAKLNTYVAGSPSTPLQTFSDVALTVLNANPVVASAFGLFGPIYLTPGLSYKFALTDAAGVAIWTQDNVAVPVVNNLAAGTGITLATVAGVTTITATAGASVPAIGLNDFRLTLESGVPISITDQLAKGTLYCTPGGSGNRIALGDAAGVPTIYSSAQFSIAVPAVANQTYDVFAYANAGVPTLELNAWRNSGQAVTDATNATPIVVTAAAHGLSNGDEVYLDGIGGNTAANGIWIVSAVAANTYTLVGSVGNGAYTAATGYMNARAVTGLLTLATTGTYTKIGDLTRRWLGVMRTTVASQTENSVAKRYVQNYCNAVRQILFVREATDSWAYTLAAYRQMNGAAGNQLDFVNGVPGRAFHAEVRGANSSTTNSPTWLSIGLDSTTVPAVNVLGISAYTFTVASGISAFSASLDLNPVPGRHTIVPLERSTASGVTTWYGDNADATLVQTGIYGWIEG